MKINVEGGEVIGAALGMPGAKVEGPSHTKGGLDVLVAPGATIFSKRIKRDGETMAKRKEKRDKEINKKLEKLKDNPLDFLLVNALSRTIQTNAQEEREDLEIQESKTSKKAGEETTEYALGTGPFGVIPTLDDIFGGARNMAGMVPGVGPMVTPSAPPTPLLPTITNPVQGAYVTPPLQVGAPDNGLAQRAANIPTVANEPQPYPFSPTAGDANVQSAVGGAANIAGLFGPVGAAVGMVAPLALTLLNRGGEARERNFMEGVGAEALATQSQAFDAARMGRDRVGEQIELGRNAALSLPTTNINANRAFRSAVTAQTNEAQRRNEADYQQTFSNLLGERARMQGQYDVLTRQGASAAFTNAQSNRDNFYTNLAQNSTNIARGLMFLANQRKQYTLEDLFNG